VRSRDAEIVELVALINERWADLSSTVAELNAMLAPGAAAGADTDEVQDGERS
jgi:hypothetical protein